MVASETALIASVALLQEAECLRRVAQRVDSDVFIQALDLLQPTVGFTAVGKSGHVARRAAASFSSVGCPAVYVDANEALHGDLGLLRSCSVIVLISNSGSTNELLQTFYSVRHQVPTILIFGADVEERRAQGYLRPHVVLDASVPAEVDPTGRVPTASLVAQSAWCDALLVSWMTRYGTTIEQFRANHPGGAIGDQPR